MADRLIRTLAVVVLITATASACSSGAGSVAADRAKVTIGGQHVALTVTSCTTSEQATHVVAQHGGEWTLDLRHNPKARSDILVLVQHAGTSTVIYQAVSNAVHPSGTPPTRIAVRARHDTFRGTATVQRAGSAGGSSRKTTAASFEVSCGPATA